MWLAGQIHLEELQQKFSQVLTAPIAQLNLTWKSVCASLSLNKQMRETFAGKAMCWHLKLYASAVAVKRIYQSILK